MPTEPSVARKLELGGGLVAAAAALTLAGAALPSLLTYGRSTESVFEDYIPDPFKTRVFAVAASNGLELLGLGLLLGAGAMALGVLAAGIAECERGAPLINTRKLLFIATPVLAALLATADVLAACVVAVVAAAIAMSRDERRVSPVLCIGASVAVSAGAWVTQAAHALSAFERVGTRFKPNLAELLSHWPNIAPYAGLIVIFGVAVALKFGLASEPRLRPSLAALSLSTALVFPNVGLAGWTIHALDQRARCPNADDERVRDVLVLPGPAAIGECVPRKVIVVSEAGLQLDNERIEHGDGCERHVADVLSQRMSVHFVLATQGTTMQHLECVLRGLHHGDSVRGMWEQSDPPSAISSQTGTSSGFIARADHQAAPWPLLAWNALPLRSNFTIVEQVPDPAFAVLRVELEQWYWGRIGQLEPLAGSGDERLADTKRRLGSEPFAVLQFAPQVSTSLVQELIRSAAQPLLLLGPSVLLAPELRASRPGSPLGVNEPSNAELLPGPAIPARITLEHKLLRGKISAPDLDAELGAVPRRLDSCFLSKPQRELRVLVRFAIQRYGDVVDVTFLAEPGKDVDQRCIRRALQAMRPPIPSSAFATVELELVVTPSG